MCCLHGLPVCLGKRKSQCDMPTAARNIGAKRTRGAALDSYAIRIGRHQTETYTTRTRCSGTGELSEEGPAVRPSMFRTRTRNQFTAVVHRLRNPHPRPRVCPEGDRRERHARFCVGTPKASRRAVAEQYLETWHWKHSCGRKSTTHITMVCKNKPSVAFMVCLGKQSRIATCLPWPRI